MEGNLAQTLNFPFVTKHNERNFGVIPRGQEAVFSWSKTQVYEIPPKGATPIEVFGDLKSEVIEKYLSTIDKK